MVAQDPSAFTDVQSVADLRALYRAAEGRAARLRLLIEAGRDLAGAGDATLAPILAASARKAALFVGAADGEVSLGEDAEGIALVAPGPAQRRVGALRLHGAESATVRSDHEDDAALAMLAQLMAAAIDRVAHERERERLLALLQERERSLEDVVKRLFSAQEEERRRVSRELHDGVAQTASALFRKLEARAATSEDSTAADLAIVAQGLVRELRAVIGGLRPTVLDDLGLQAAVSAMADNLAAAGFDVVFRGSGPTRWPSLLETAFFRVAQEAINNVSRHAGGPCRVDVSVDGDPAAQVWTLCVRDFGRGFDARSSTSAAAIRGEHIGLEVMRERIGSIGGTLTIKSEPGAGVEVFAQMSPKT